MLGIQVDQATPTLKVDQSEHTKLQVKGKQKMRPTARQPEWVKQLE